MTEVFPRGIHDHRHVSRSRQAQLSLQSVDHTEDGTGRAPPVIRQAGVYVVGAVQVGRTVNQQQVGPRLGVSHVGKEVWRYEGIAHII